MQKNTVADFWKQVDKTDGCWIWTGLKIMCRGGYGYFWLEGKMHRVHRLAWRLTKGEIPPGMFVCHACDVRNCVNPDHLFLGTHQDNMDDMVRKGRATGRPDKGEKASRAKLTEAQVIEIRRLAAEGATRSSIARQFGICKSNVFAVVHRLSWTHI